MSHVLDGRRRTDTYVDEPDHLMRDLTSPPAPPYTSGASSAAATSLPSRDAAGTNAPSGADVVPTARELIAIGMVALIARVLVFGVGSYLSHWSLADFANLNDGESYLRVAGDMIDPSTVVAHFDRRVFIGYPSLIALGGLVGLPLAASALAVSWLSSAAAAIFAAKLFADRRIGWALAVFPPSWIHFSTLAMSEAALLAFVAAGVYAVIRRQWIVVGALALGFAGLVRPVACFAVLGILALYAYRRAWRRGVLVGGISAAVVGAGFYALRLWRGDALEGVKIYATSKHSFGGELFTWPFESLITTPLQMHVPAWQIAYVWLCVAFVLGGCVLAAVKARRQRESARGDLALLSAVWLGANTLFVLCMGNKYGFYYFDRHIIVALPPLLWAYADRLPRHLATWIIVGIASVAAGLMGVLSSVV